MTLLVTPAPASFPPEPGRVAMWPKAEREIGASGLTQATAWESRAEGGFPPCRTRPSPPKSTETFLFLFFAVRDNREGSPSCLASSWAPKFMFPGRSCRA